MKTHPASQATQGNVLVICLCTCAVIGFAIASCYAMVRNQMAVAARSQSWNESLVISEAGIEDGLALINKYSDTAVARGVWAQGQDAANDNWTTISTTGPRVFHVQRSMNSNFYNTYVTNSADGQPWILSIGTKQVSGLGSAVALRRAIVVRATPGSLFQGGLIAKGGVSLQGNVVVDSFNSQVAGMNTNGQYHPSIRRDNGVIASASSNVVATVTVGGSVEIYGKVFTGPEDGFVYNGNVAIGSESYVDGGSTGPEAGSSQNDLNMYIPDAPTPPTSGGLPLLPKATVSFQGTNYANSQLLGTGGYYKTGSINLQNTEKILVLGNVKLYVTGNFKMTGGQVIIGANSSLTLYAGGDVDLGGGGVVNKTGFATNLTVNGLTTCTSIKYSGSSDFIGTIYAPQADLELTGGGSTDLHFSGSAVADTIKLSGHTQVHYDESLNQLPVGPHYYVTAWREIAL